MTNYVDLMSNFGDAFNKHDGAALASMMTDDCIFYTLAGDHSYGNEIAGKEAVRAAFEGVFATIKDAHWKSLDCFASGDVGLSHWLFTGTNPDGSRIEAQGCDIFSFEDGKIATKNAFRKQCPTK